jgi:hypothetical protein
VSSAVLNLFWVLGAALYVLGSAIAVQVNRRSGAVLALLAGGLVLMAVMLVVASR